jgi:hypothetical protein
MPAGFHFDFRELRRRTVKQPVNPMDRATIVSIYPRLIEERKYTIEPGLFVIPPGSYEKPAVCVVGPSSWWREIDEEMPLLEIPVSSIQIAESVVRDYSNGLFMYTPEQSAPGLFYTPGEHTSESIKEKFKTQLDKALRLQRKWYENLINAADALWARSQGNPLTISEDSRLAARELGVAGTKDWMKTFVMVSMVRCKACGSLKNPEFPICATCHFPDPDHPMTKKLLEVKGQLPKQA